MIRSAVAFNFSVAMTLAIAACPAWGQAGDGQGSQTNIDGFAVVGKGVVAGKPNRLEIDLEVAASSELTSDAIVKYRDAKKKLQDAFATLKMTNVTVEERGLQVDQKGQSYNPYYMDMPPARKGKAEVQLRRKLVVSVSNVRSMDEEAVLQLVAKLLDVAQDAGGKVGGPEPNPYYYNRFNQGNKLVRFVLDDFEALQEKAYAEAIANARAKAGRLAKLGGVDLGGVAGIRELIVPGEKASAAGMPYYYYYEMQSEPDEEMPRKRLVASRFQEIPVHVELFVRFDLTRPAKVAKRGAE